MPTPLLTVGTGLLKSSDFVVQPGVPMSVTLKAATGTDVSGTAQVRLMQKDDVGEYWEVDCLGGRRRSITIQGPGTYQLWRTDTSGSCGAFSG